MAMDLKQHIGIRLKQARKQAGLTQERLAEKVKKYPETISNIERGSVYVGLKLLERLAAALGVPISYFFEDAEASKGGSRSRIEGTDQIRGLTSKLTGPQLALAIAVLETLATYGSKNRRG
jgi:transcriptional regulator with XRE-family HTH domain